ncbi:autotransporter assembly complex protein TamA [Pseudoxanthomonas indica]|uniref:Translocation and assembly module subunit TamA n=1 Tax=Pseudoxanthomonas indica TaxID=428993 RepID=A0A1T5KSE2_9GAMM|nr:autotransporter assembly complex family protein [Pseudoxanthomonas indica]SKC66319.1 autotransporter secretion outer membrane protein TamA [Pseudoxanthomonas indica]
MPRTPPHALLLLILLLACPGLARAAATIDKVQIEGIEDELMVENINVALSLNDVLGDRLGESRLEYLLGEAEAQTREALEPFGYYTPTIKVDARRSGATEDERVTVVIQIALGEPVRVRRSSISIDGEGHEDRYLKEDLADFAPRVGEIFDHTTYEASKLKIVRRLADRGYFDADFTQRKVEVTRAEHAADVDLAWVSGIRYDMGPTTFHQTYFVDGLLDKLVYWEEGSYFHQGKLDRLRESLLGLDYFANIDIQANPDKAVDGQVPIDVNLSLAKRTLYTAGVSYGSESGPGIRLGLDRRYINSRGHKLSTQLDYATKRKILTSQYRIPAFKWLDGWFAIGLQASDEQTDYIDLRHVEFFASRSGQITEDWTAVASIHTLRERWAYYDESEVDDQGNLVNLYRYATFTYPQLKADYLNAPVGSNRPDKLAGSVVLRGGVEGAGSDANFAQLHIRARWSREFGRNSALIFRGEVGHTYTNALVDMPPSLRFFAGGDGSIRGYAWREVGPRSGDYALGAKNVVTGSAEYEWYPNSGQFGGAVFVDTGSAFNSYKASSSTEEGVTSFDGDDDGSFNLRTGIGIGLRWRSPVGPVRLDIAHGLNDPDSQFQIYLNIGTSL